MPTQTAEELVRANLAESMQPFVDEFDGLLLRHGWPIGANGLRMHLILGNGEATWVEADMPEQNLLHT
jgi:hypothetical protein